MSNGLPQPEIWRAAALSRLLGGGLLALVAVTWKLWTPQTDFPQVPLIRMACDCPGWIDWCLLAMLIGCSITLLICGRAEKYSRWAAIGIAGSLAGFFLLDQHRLQPWAWQFCLLATLLALANDSIACRGARWLAISIYFWSAVSKLDYNFCHEQGVALIWGLKEAVGMAGPTNQWIQRSDIASALGLAIGEMTVSLLLALPVTRWVGLWIATIMHVALLAALGPLGMRHSTGVLMWNVVFIVQDWLLFAEPRRRILYEPSSARISWISRLIVWFDWPRPLRDRMALGVIGVAMIWPVLEPWGWCDHWLAWAVYSARPGKVEIVKYAHDEPGNRIPVPTEMFLGMTGHTGDHPIQFESLQIAQWSLNKLDVPIYPQDRFQVGVLWYLVARHRLKATLVLHQPKNRWNGEPMGMTITEVEDASPHSKLVRLADSYFWNARPRWIGEIEQLKPPPPG